MLTQLLKNFFGDRNQRLLKSIGKIVDKITILEAEISALNDQQLAAKTVEFRARIAAGETKDELLVAAFAVMREAATRTIGLRHFDVQLIGGVVLNSGKIAEMKTGEGKTLVATLPAYLNAIAGIPVHIVTVNDYLAARDAEWMGDVYRFLGLSVGVIHSGQDPEEKRMAYQSDIVYGTNNEFGFDYLRDNMTFTAEGRLQNGLGFVIVDEVDSILIDEARTPLIISGHAEESTSLYVKINAIASKLKRCENDSEFGDFSLDEKRKQIVLTEQGHEVAEKLLGDAGLLPEGSSLYEIGNVGLLHHVNAALRAHHLFHRDVEYIVRDEQVTIIDEFTGRMMSGRRWSDGLHQAVEAKENVTIQKENQTLASITFQNYFRLYQTISGMTGTADTEATEFAQIYGLEVVIIPTNRPMIRGDKSDLVYRTESEKLTAIVDAIKDCRIRRQPVLVGTASIESSEKLSMLLDKEDIRHKVLNAKNHGEEAFIIAEAGRPEMVTIATNMAGRGTDIVLGGNLQLELSKENENADLEQIKQSWEQRHREVIEAGGLHVLGTERNESRRVDNQLRGRCGRQGDPGSTRYYLSLEDSLMRIFGSERISGLMQKLGMEKGEAIEHPWITRAIVNAQMKVEGHNFDARKQLLEYDDVANEQRKVVYQQRNMLIESGDISEHIVHTRQEVTTEIINRYITPNALEEQWDVNMLMQSLETDLGAKLPIKEWLDTDTSLHEETLRAKIQSEINEMMRAKEERVGAESMRLFEKMIMLRALDDQWKDHLFNMDHLRQGIHLRGYGQKNPKQEYKREAFDMFTVMLESIKFEATSLVARLHIPTTAEIAEMEAQNQQQKALNFVHPEASMQPAEQSQPTHPMISDDQPFVRKSKKIGRNDPCPCNSGKKYKQCHGKL